MYVVSDSVLVCLVSASASSDFRALYKCRIIIIIKLSIEEEVKDRREIQAEIQESVCDCEMRS